MPPDHYQTLGLPPSSTPEEIKKRYRSLARQYHPDVNASPEAAQKITRINEAYHILGDADRRALYDAERMLTARAAPKPTAKTAPKPPPPKPEVRPRSAAPPSPRPMEFNGFGRASRPDAAPAPPKRPASSQAADAFRDMDRFIVEAQLAFINRQYREAETLCMQALQIDRRNATAHEILGDVFIKRGLTESAVKAYSYAVQFNPRNLTVQAKLERLSGKRNAAPGPTLTNPTPASWNRVADGANRETVLTAASGIFGSLFVGLCFLLYLHPGHSFQDAIGWFSDISFNLLATFFIGGTLAGALLALNGGMRPISEELLARGTLHGNERTPISMGAVLAVFAFVWFYASFLIYIGIALARNRLSLSILRVYGVTFLLVALFALLYQSAEMPSGLWQTLAFGGNFLFPAMLFGWAVGDALRLRER